MATETKERRKPGKSGLADGFVMMAMAVVTLALCMGLVAQVGLSFGLSVTVSAAFYMGLLTLHTLVRRHDQLDELRAEVDRLTGEVARLNQHPAGSVARAPQPATASAPAPGTRGAALPPTPAAAPAPNADPLARVAAAMVTPAASTAATSSTDTARPRSEEAPPLAKNDGKSETKPASAPGAEPELTLSDIAAAAEPRDPQLPQMQKIVRAPSIAPHRPLPFGDPLSHTLELPMGTTPSKSASSGAESGGPSLPGGPSAISRTRRAMAAEVPAATTAHERSGAPTGTTPSTAPVERTPPAPVLGPASRADKPNADRTGADQTRSDQTGVDQMAARMSSAPNSSAPAPAASVPPPRQQTPAQTDASDTAWAYRPGESIREAGFSPSESDVEMIQGLIKKLADEVNSADAHKLVLERSREAVDSEALDRSVGALRQAARNMQEPASAGAVPAAGKSGPPPLPQPQPQPQSKPATAAAAKAPAPQSHVHQPVTEADVRASDGEEAGAGPAAVEFDVEALMRRAQPIATMSSMPPPLPAAPNIMDKRTAPPPPPAPAPAAEAAPAAAVASSAATDSEELWGVAADSVVVEEVEARADSMVDRLARIADAIEAGRVDVYLEPILDLEKQQARHFEVSVRLTDANGGEISPDDAIEAERPSGALPLLDCLRLKRTAQVARRLEERNKQGSVFSTFSGPSLTADNFLATFAETYEQQVQLAGQLVLTFTQADARLFRTPHWTMITEMRDLGFGFALRAVTDLDMDFELLANAGFKFVKLDADVFLSGLPTSDAIVPAADLCKYLEKLNLTPVVEAIDDAEKREQVFAYGARLGQGPLFGGARQIKAPAGASSDRSAAA